MADLQSRLLALEARVTELEAVEQRLLRLEATWGTFIASAMEMYTSGTATAATGAEEMGTANGATGAEETGTATAATGAEESGTATAATGAEETGATGAEERGTATAWMLSIWRRAEDSSWQPYQRIEF